MVAGDSGPPRELVKIYGLSPDLRFRAFPRAYRLELAEAFSGEGYGVRVFESLALASLAMEQSAPAALIIDWRAETLDLVRRYSGIMPVLVLTKHNVLLDVVSALKAGALDYVRLPCFFPEILARLQRGGATLNRGEVMRLGGLSLDLAKSQISIDGEGISLSDREARMLAALMRNPGQPVSREALMRVAGITKAKPTIVESYIKQLRKRAFIFQSAIKTHYKKGYSLLQNFEKNSDSPP